MAATHSLSLVVVQGLLIEVLLLLQSSKLSSCGAQASV